MDGVTLTTKLALDVFRLSDKYGFKELSDVCEKFLSESLTLDTIIDVVNLIAEHDVEGLKKPAENFISLALSGAEEVPNNEKVSKPLLQEALLKLKKTPL